MSSTALTTDPKPTLRQRVRARVARTPKPALYVAASAAAGGVAAYVGANKNARTFLAEKAHDAGETLSELTTSDNNEE